MVGVTLEEAENRLSWRETIQGRQHFKEKLEEENSKFILPSIFSVFLF